MAVQKLPARWSWSGDESQGLDAADDESDDDRDEGDGQVVVELAHGLDEGPAVGAEHEDVVGGVDERHARSEEDGEDEDGAERKSAGGFGGGDAEQADFGCGVEAEAEEDAEGYMCQLRRIMANMGRKRRERNPRLARSISKSSST